MAPQDHLKLTREDLHNLVWKKPMTEVAKDFQISDLAMAKICARKQVPVPPRGYWAKKTAGQNVSKPPLPEFVAKPPKEKKVEATPPPQPAKKPKSAGVFEEREQKIKKSLKELRSTLPEAIAYVARIESWNCDYSFGLNQSYNPLRRDYDLSFIWDFPLSEYRDLVLKGVVHEPRRLKKRGIDNQVYDRFCTANLRSLSVRLCRN